MPERIPCPACREGPLVIRAERLDIAYFDDVVEFVYLCESCGFRRTDFQVLGESEPVRYRVDVTEPVDLSIRVVRSASGHFEIPELGVRADPSEAADAFVSNVEGVLERCAFAVRTALGGAEDGETRERARDLLDRVERLRALSEKWSVILEDPLGNSAILSDKAERTRLSPEEVGRLGAPSTFLKGVPRQGSR